jgi:hypothetical protein
MVAYEAPQSKRRSYHYIHLTSGKLEVLLLEELRQVCLEFRGVLLAVMGIFYTPRRVSLLGDSN